MTLVCAGTIAAFTSPLLPAFLQQNGVRVADLSLLLSTTLPSDSLHKRLPCPSPPLSYARYSPTGSTSGVDPFCYICAPKLRSTSIKLRSTPEFGHYQNSGDRRNLGDYQNIGDLFGTTSVVIGLQYRW
ncbi:hypothetical protein B0H16DRAFT_1734464 [Mycena metata]|uniref:Uncharacterized protein n=1 Tax=Mycena metata TaxID=1033252 RepID=A0AAD7HV34_9AGAR|nr:hypothetical protein B0H16DRAFT_1734464 [Mycena metata]